MEFRPFAKIPRLSRDVIISEKIDGTNASIWISEEGEFRTASRNRWITPEDDNYGFSRWAHEHKEELMQLGPGVHFGEWWGQGIQRNYGLKEKRFSLFNVGRWVDRREDEELKEEDKRIDCPECCYVVPIIYQGLFDTVTINNIVYNMKHVFGSYAVNGYMDPEGIIIYHTASRRMFKKTLENDEKPKSMER